MIKRYVQHNYLYCVRLIPMGYMFRPYMRVIIRPLHKCVLKELCILGSLHANITKDISKRCVI